MGDPATGLTIGATLQLMSMGVVAVGGSSMPDYPVAAIIATAIACSTGRGMESGLAIGLPVAMLGVNFDVIYKIFNGFLEQKEVSLIEEGKFNSFLRLVKVSPIFYGLCSAVPVFLCVAISLMLFWISCQLGLQLDYQLPEVYYLVLGWQCY